MLDTPVQPLPRSLWAAVLVIALTGCARNLAEIEEMYSRDVVRAKARASSIIFVPGIMGVELRDSEDGRVVWGTFFQKDDDEHLLDIALPLAVDQAVSDVRDSIVPGGELLVVNLQLAGGELHARGYPGVLEGLLQALMDEGAHHHPRAISKKDAMEGRDPIIGFGYDWRRDLASEAQRFHETVVAASEERRLRAGRSRIDVIAHSMGTQLVRWYLRYGTSPVPADGSLPELTWAGVRYIERVLLVGAPNSGSAAALTRILEGSHENPLITKYPPALVATFPAAFELMPRVDDGLVVWADTGTPVDLYDVEIWERLAWGPFAPEQDRTLSALVPEARSRDERLAVLRKHMRACLFHAQTFHRALDRLARPPDALRMHTFVGDAHETNAVLEVDRRTGEIDWAASEAGDGTVTRSSALGYTRSAPEAVPRVQAHSAHFYDSTHLPMVGDPDFLDDALYFLLEAPDPPGDPSTAPE